MKRRRVACYVSGTFIFLILAAASAKLSAQISPVAPTKEYIRLGDRIIAIEQTPVSNMLPTGWTAAPVNSSCSLNSTTFDKGVYAVKGTGSNGLATTSDMFEFASVPVTGDATLVGRIPTGFGGYQAANFGVGLML